ncbi:MAG: fibronectin type III domain-containing protein [Bacteroidales bacterium]
MADPLEPTAAAESYVVYTRVNAGGFDNGTRVSEPRFRWAGYHPDSIYSFRVTAVNRGGESFPSEVASVYHPGKGATQVLIVNAFDRTSGPAWFADEEHSGFLSLVDEGVPWQADLLTVGAQFEFERNKPWLDDDAPGHGASYADLEQLVLPGNTFDFAVVHGRALAAAGYGFVTVSDEALAEGRVDPGAYALLDFLAGEERTSPLPKSMDSTRFRVFEPAMWGVLETYLDGGGALLLSGAHVASDAHLQGQDGEAARLLGAWYGPPMPPGWGGCISPGRDSPRGA